MMMPTAEEILGRFASRLACHYEPGSSPYAPSAGTLASLLSSSSSATSSVVAGVGSGCNPVPPGDRPCCVFPSLSLKRPRSRSVPRKGKADSSRGSASSTKNRARRTDRAGTPPSRESSQEVDKAAPSSVPSSTSLRLQRSEYEKEEDARDLRRCLRVGRRTLALAPSSLLRNMLRSFGSVLDRRMQRTVWTLMENSKDGKSAEATVDALCRSNSSSSSPIVPVAATINFYTIPYNHPAMDDPVSIATVAESVHTVGASTYHQAPGHSQKSSSSSISGYEGYFTGAIEAAAADDARMAVPLIFEATIDVDVLGLKTVTAQLRAPGTIYGTFQTNRSRPDEVEITLDTAVLVKTMWRECKDIVKLAMVLVEPSRSLSKSRPKKKRSSSKKPPTETNTKPTTPRSVSEAQERSSRSSSRSRTANSRQSSSVPPARSSMSKGARVRGRTMSTSTLEAEEEEVEEEEEDQEDEEVQEDDPNERKQQQQERFGESSLATEGTVPGVSRLFRKAAALPTPPATTQGHEDNGTSTAPPPKGHHRRQSSAASILSWSSLSLCGGGAKEKDESGSPKAESKPRLKRRGLLRRRKKSSPDEKAAIPDSVVAAPSFE